MWIRRTTGAGACAMILLAGLMAPAQTSPHSNDATLVKEFGARVSHYLEMRKKQAGSSPKPTNSSAKLAQTEQQIAANVRAVRPDARQGDIFTPEVANYFRRQIAATLTSPRGATIRASMRHAEPVAPMPLRVNESYPRGVPLQSTPPTLLLNLPKLPKEMEYRIVGHDLVLHDIEANLVVDFIPNVFPSS